MRITVYDGGETIGGNKIYVQIDEETGFFFDFGNNFFISNKYFHDYLTERSVRGINTYIELGMIPKIKIYRSDLIPTDLDVSSFPELPVNVVLLSHAHADHAGMIGVLDESIGVVASPITLALLKALRTPGRHTSAPTSHTSNQGQAKMATFWNRPETEVPSGDPSTQQTAYPILSTHSCLHPRFPSAFHSPSQTSEQ